MTPSLSRPLAFLALALALVHGAAAGAEMQLYESGPAEDAAFVRFVNGGQAPLSVTAGGSKASLDLDAAQPVSAFLPVRAGSALRGEVAGGDARQPVAVKVEPGEFATVVAIPGRGKSLRIATLHEQPDDFNALKASIAFYNLDGSCVRAGLLAAGPNVAIFENVGQDTVVRRQVNPVALSIQASCDGQAAGAPAELGTLAAGERYSVFLLPTPQGPRLLTATDALAH